MQEHLRKCEACRKEISLLEELYTQLNRQQEVLPPVRLKTAFDRILDQERGTVSENPTRNFPVHTREFSIKRWVAAAACVLFLVTAGSTLILLGRTITMENRLARMESVSNEISDLLMAHSFDHLSTSQRINVLELLDRQPSISPEQIGILKETMENDQNTNVKSSAAWVLMKNYRNPAVRPILADALINQPDLYVRLTILRYLASTQDQAFLRLVRQIGSSESEPQMIRNEAARLVAYYN